MGNQKRDRAGRIVAALIATVTALTLGTRIYLRMRQPETLGAALAHLTQFFTVLTNTLTLLVMTTVALGRGPGARILRATTLWIVAVGVIYHLLLAHLVHLTGLELWADHGVHTIVPLATGIWWVLFAAKPPLKRREPLLWMAWPFAYCAYILVRASVSGFYPYPFLDAPTLGWPRIAANVVGLLIGFVVLGLLLTALGRLLDRRRPI